MSWVVEGAWQFAYLYPLFMSYVWMVGAIIYYRQWERPQGHTEVSQPPRLPEHPMVSILVPCHNEEAHVAETIEALNRSVYPNFEIIAINDGSTDRTGAILDAIAEHLPRLRVVHLATNHGKAMGLRIGTLVSNSEYLVCVDGDVIIDRYALRWMLWHMLTGPRVGAVTGNPRVRTRSTLLGKIQVGEFSSIIGLIKRAQRVYGRLFTVSGAIAAFRRGALQRVGYWDRDMITEDIDISWKLQLDHWDVRYEPNALCWLLMPETFRGLWRQRRRWAQGGAEVLLKYLPHLLRRDARRMRVVYLEFLLSLVWAYTMIAVFATWAIGKFVQVPDAIYIPTLIPGWTGLLLGLTCLFQFAVALRIDSRYEPKLARYFYWMIWYPVAYWLMNVATIAVGFPRAVIRRSGQAAVWSSSDRGVTP